MQGFLTTARLILITVSLHLATNAVWAESSASVDRPDKKQRRLAQVDKAVAKYEESRASTEQIMRELDAEMQAAQKDVQMLRMREFDIEAEMQRAAIDEERSTSKAMQREMVEIQHQLQRRQLDLERLFLDRDRHMEQREMKRMSDRFEYVANWQEVAFEPPSAVMMATQALVELHIADGHPERAAERLEALLKQLSDPGSRTAIRFALKDVYTELGHLDKAEKHMIKIILENATSLQSESSE